MRLITLCALAAYFALISPSRSYGQCGWNWAVTNSDSNSAEACLVTNDVNGNAFVAYEPMGHDTVSLGSAHVHLDHLLPIMIAKFDSSSNVLWTLTTNVLAVPYAIETDASGNLFIVGAYFESPCMLDTVSLTATGSTPSMAFVAKITPAGHVLWARNLAGQTDENGFGLGVDNAGNVYVDGEFKGASLTLGATVLTNVDVTGATTDLFVAKLDNNGNFLWARGLGGRQAETPTNPPSNFYSTNPMMVTGDGSVYFFGFSGSDTLTASGTMLTDTPKTFIAKYNSSGTLQWCKPTKYATFYGGAADNAGNLYLTGEVGYATVLGSDTTLSYGYVLIKYDSSGNIRWAKSSDNGAFGCLSHGYAVATDKCGHVFVTSSFDGCSQKLDGHSLPMPGSYDPAFIATYDTAGNYDTALTMISGGDDAIGISADNRGNIYVSGDYTHSSMQLGSYTLDSVSAIHEKFFIAKYKYAEFDCAACGTKSANGVAGVAQEPFIDIYPNPASGALTIASSDVISKVDIISFLGQRVFSGAYSASKVVIDISALPPGSYLARINNGAVRKIVKAAGR